MLLAQLADIPSLCATGFPTKLFEYMAARRPIVYAGTGICANILDAAGAAVVVPPRDIAAYARAVQSLVTEPAIGAKLVDAGVRYLDALGTREAAMGRLVDAVRGLVPAPVPTRHA